MNSASVSVRGLRHEDEAALRGVMRASLEFDAFPGFDAWSLEGEAWVLIGTPEGVAVAVDDGVVCGYVSPLNDALVVHPEYRRRGHGRRLFAAGIELAERAGFGDLQLYVPFDRPGSAFGRAMGLTYRSSLWRLLLPPETPVPDPAFPGDVTVRTFGDWLPLERLVGLLNESFAGHPSPISFTVAEIEHAHSKPDFDPSSMALVAPVDRPDEPFGFVRTGLEPPVAGQAPTGEVRLVGVLPAWRGRGFGRELLRLGVAELRHRGAGHVQLSVEAENELALGLYRRTGFEPVVEWPHWTRPV
jgi:mycothiol synthase